MADIRHEETPGGGAFATGTGADRAELTYSVSDGGKLWVFDHTYVPQSQRGQGLAEKLLAFATEAARAAGVKVFPTCSYVVAQFRRHPDRYADIATE